MRKSIIWICILFLLVSFVSAQPPFQEQSNIIEGLVINFPLLDTFEQNKDISFNFHVYNQTSGLIMTNATTSCVFHLFDNKGDHLIDNKEMPFDSNGVDFEITLSGSNFSRLGAYSFLVNCNTSIVGGFDMHSLRITSSGFDDTPIDNSSGIAIVIFILSITGALFLFSMKKDILMNKYANIIVRRSFLVLGIYLMILNSAIMATLAATSNLPLVQEMFFYMNLFGYIGYPTMVLLMLSALFQSMRDWKKDKKNKRTGEEDGEE